MEKSTMEFKIENISQVSEVLEKAKMGISNTPGIVIRFVDNISIEDLLGSLKQLWQYELSTGQAVDILIKNLSYEHRKEALRCALKNPQLKNPIFLSNIFCLVKGYNTFEDSYFSHEHVFLNDEVEFLDIFDDLEEEIKVVTFTLGEYYISMLKTCNLVEGVENNPHAVKMEPLYEYLFGMLDVTILAKILTSIKDPSVWETKKVVLGGLNYLGIISEKFVFTNTLLNLLGDRLLQDSVQHATEQ